MLTVTQQLLILSCSVLATSPDPATWDQDQDHEIQAKVTTTAPGSRHLQPTEVAVCKHRTPCPDSTRVDEGGRRSEDTPGLHWPCPAPHLESS